jgi:hypothetical protein
LELAERASLAARDEPQLLRALRTEVGRRLDIGAKTNLFCSELIEARSSAGIILRGGLLPMLTRSLRNMTPFQRRDCQPQILSAKRREKGPHSTRESQVRFATSLKHRIVLPLCGANRQAAGIQRNRLFADSPLE